MHTYIRLLSFFSLLCLALAQAQATNPTRSGFTDRLIVKMKDAAVANTGFSVSSAGGLSNTRLSSSELSTPRLSNTQVNALATSVGQSLHYVKQTAHSKAHVMGLEGHQSIAQVKQLAKKMMESDDNIEYVEPDYRMFPNAVVPNDREFFDQWHLQSASIQGLNLPEAWEYTTGSSDVVVAIVDTGILADHPEFDPARLLPGYDFVSPDIQGTFVGANDGDGRDADPTDPGDWVTELEAQDSSSPMYECQVGRSGWHGTHVAGTVGASTNNNIGVSGVDWAAKILPVRVLGKCGGYTSDIADGIIWASGGAVSGAPVNDNPANVINLSLGSDGFCSFTMQTAIDRAFNAGATLIVAAGNESSSTAFVTPASCDNVIVVGAYDNQGHLSDFSNFGSEVDVLAPGGSNAAESCANTVLSLFNTGEQSADSHTLGCLVGTSMAAPHVSGLAALMLSRNPDLTPVQIETWLKSSTREYPSGSGCTSLSCGTGLADAHAAIMATAIPYAPSGLIAQNDNGTVQLTWQDNADLESGYKIEYANNNGPFETAFITQANATHYEHADAKDGLGHYRLSAVNGEFSSVSITVSDVDVPFKTISVLNASAASNAVTLTWQDNSNYETGVEIYRAVESDAYVLMTTAAENAERYIDEDVADGQFYRYQLRAIKADAQGEFVETQQIQTPLFEPTHLQGVMASSQVSLTWQDNTHNESAYQVERSDNGTHYFVVATLGANTERYTESNDQSVATYYRVKALSDKTAHRSLNDEPVTDSAYSNVEIIEQVTKSKSGAFSMMYVALLFLFMFYRRRLS